VDPVTHSLTGAVLSRAGLNRATPLATATLVLAANAPDIDILSAAQGGFTTLAFRRGLTHGPLALLLLPGLVAAAVLLYDRLWRRRRRPELPAVRPRAVLGLAFIGTLTHPLLDWMNTYGIRLLMPFSDRWFYGDALFIIDPWLWLLLALPLVALARSRRARLGWLLLGTGASLMVLLAPQVPLGARIIWVVALGMFAAYTAPGWRRAAAGAAATPPARLARVAALCAAVYIAGMVVSGRLARAETARVAAAHGLEAQDLMIGPQPANPFAADIVVELEREYRTGRFDWLARPRVSWSGESVPKREMDDIVLATLRFTEVRDYLRWSRFPYVEVSETETGHVVRFRDARYSPQARGGLHGPVVHVERGAMAVLPLAP
jgi:inner membrane protein